MQLDTRMQRFVDSLGGEDPPKRLQGALRGCWHALRGEWQAAHDAVQGDSEGDSWVHAALHRQEGDHGNARYWYDRAKRPVATGASRQEFLKIAACLLA